jgi:hypothetical protein
MFYLIGVLIAVVLIGYSFIDSIKTEFNAGNDYHITIDEFATLVLVLASSWLVIIYVALCYLEDRKVFNLYDTLFTIKRKKKK